MPNHRKPVELHILNGSYKKNPSRKPKGFVKAPEVLGNAPSYFDADELATSMVLGPNGAVDCERMGYHRVQLRAEALSSP
jgi:hypothetical protein